MGSRPCGRGRTRTLAVLLLALAIAMPALAAGARAQEKIVGGEPAGEASFPFVAALWVTGVDTPWCDGTLIAPNRVLLAATCTYYITTDPNLGNTAIPFVPADLTLTFSGDGPDLYALPKYAAKKIIRHPDFDFTTCLNQGLLIYFACHNDAAIIELSSGPQGISPVDLVASGKDGVGKKGRKLTAVGWSGEYVNFPTSSTLTQATMPVSDQELCGRRYEGLNNIGAYPPVEFDSAGNFCTYKLVVGPCYQELGGPALSKRHHRWLQIGVLNTINDCAQAKWPNIYTRMSEPAMNDWIRATAKLPASKAANGGR
ncbi:MAG: trypsin-like serine protease [Thermomicrobiales bacterium]